MSDLLQIIATIPMKANEELRISLTEFRGYRLAASRVYFDPADGGERRPGKSGINIRVEQVRQIIEARQMISGGAT